ncbi:MAG: cation transporter, partial [Caldimonas sp.]
MTAHDHAHVAPAQAVGQRDAEPGANRGHGHAHEHGHGHGHALEPHRPEDFSRAFAVGIVLNLAFLAVEAFYGWKVDSLALLADAGHNLSDVAGLAVAWAGAKAANLRPDARYTYGWKR